MGGPGSGKQSYFYGEYPDENNNGTSPQKRDKLKSIFGDRDSMMGRKAIVERWNRLIKKDLTGKYDNVDCSDSIGARVAWSLSDSFTYGYDGAPDFSDNEQFPGVKYHPNLKSPGTATGTDLGSTATDNVIVNVTKTDAEETSSSGEVRLTKPVQKNPSTTSLNIGSFIEVGKYYPLDNKNNPDFELFEGSDPKPIF